MQPARLDIRIEVEGSGGMLVLGPRRYFGCVEVERFELRVPGLSFPLQITGGIQQLRDYQTHVQLARFAVTRQGLDELVRDRESELRRAGFTDVQLRIASDHVVAQAALERGDRRAGFCCRLSARAAPPGLRLSVSNSNVFGFVGRAGLRVLYDLCAALRGCSPDEPIDGSDIALATRLSMGWLDLEPLSAFVATVFPPAKWSLPGTGEVELGALRCDDDRIALEYRAGVQAQSQVLRERVHVYLRHRAAAAAILRGQLDEAESIYTSLGRDDPGDALMVGRRLLELLIARPDTLDRAERLAVAYLADWPTFLPAHLTLAAVADAAGDTANAIRCFEHVRDLAAHAGNAEVAAEAANAVKRLAGAPLNTAASSSVDNTLY